MEKELRLKSTNGLSAFVDTIYENFFNEISNLERSLKNEKDPLHYLIINTRLEATRKALKMYEAVVDEATEFVEVQENENEL